MFLKRMGHQVLKQELIAIIRRFDLDGDSMISFKEFVEALTPLSPELLNPRQPLIFVPSKRFSPSKERPSP
jgi:Ca2+-binding EF-hand superfamily protein